jgi:CheY-like chemotaxis protein
MSKSQDGFLGKVSKGIKKSIFDDEPDVASGSLIIERLHSLAGSGSPGEAKAEHAPNTKGAHDKTEPPIAAPTASPLTDGAGYRAGNNSTAPDGTQDDDSFVAEEPIKASGSMASILVVEDEIVTQRLTRKILEERGYEVVVAEDGVDALMALGKIKFDLVLCDINMPNLDGFTLVEFMNKKDIFIPVIFMTVREDVEDEIRGLALGAKDYIRKPVNRDLLLLRIRKALGK